MTLVKKAFERIKTYQFRYLNFRLILWLYTITILGINVIASATTSDVYESKQILGLILGSIAMVVIALFDYKFVLKFYWLIYLFNVVLLLLVTLIGVDVKGAKRWIDFGFVQN